MKTKKKIILTAFVIFSISAGITYAWTIPGVDEPYDPPDYYSPTSISYPDSAPSPFAMRELSRGNVYDYTRHIKSMLFGKDFVSLDSTLLSKVLNKIIDMTGMDKNAIAETEDNVNATNANTHAVGISGNVADADQQSLFRTTATSGNNNYSYDKHSQFAWANDIYHACLQAMSNSDKDMENRMDALNTVLDNSANSNGGIESEQSAAQAAALYNSEVTRRNMLWSNYAATEAAHDRMQLDKDMEDLEAEKNGMSFPVYNPNQPTELDKKNFTKPNAPGFYDF